MAIQVVVQYGLINFLFAPFAADPVSLSPSFTHSHSTRCGSTYLHFAEQYEMTVICLIPRDDQPEWNRDRSWSRSIFFFHFSSLSLAARFLSDGDGELLLLKKAHHVHNIRTYCRHSQCRAEPYSCLRHQCFAISLLLKSLNGHRVRFSDMPISCACTKFHQRYEVPTFLKWEAEQRCCFRAGFKPQGVSNRLKEYFRKQHVFVNISVLKRVIKKRLLNTSKSNDMIYIYLNDLVILFLSPTLKMSDISKIH